MTKELTQDEINALLAEIDIDDRKIDYATRALAISASQKGKILSDEHKQKISKLFKGRIAPNKGKGSSVEHKKNNSIAQLKRYEEHGVNPESTRKTAEGLSPYYFLSPKGRFESLYELDLAYNGEYKRPQLYYLTKKGTHGFSRHKK
jgi:hypothetical protein